MPEAANRRCRLVLFMTASALVMIGGIALTAASTAAASRWTVEIEGGPVWATRNDVQIPNDANGTRFSLVDDLAAERAWVGRARLSYGLGPRSSLSLLAAPLMLRAEGSLSRDIEFDGATFTSGTPLEARYRFNSYRLTYRYDAVMGERFRLGVGATAKIRDAYIELAGGGESRRYENVGFVPLLHFDLLWRFAAPLAWRLDGDALASPGGQGRAEDIRAALVYESGPGRSFFLGYRILEGGADVDDVYNFALLQYAVLGFSLAH